MRRISFSSRNFFTMMLFIVLGCFISFAATVESAIPPSQMKMNAALTGAEYDAGLEDGLNEMDEGLDLEAMPGEAEDVSPAGFEPEDESGEILMDEEGNVVVGDHTVAAPAAPQPVETENGSLADLPGKGFEAPEEPTAVMSDEEVLEQTQEDPKKDLQESPLREYDIKNSLQNSPLRQYDIQSDLRTSPLKKYELRFSGKQAQKGVAATRSFKNYPEEGIGDKGKNWPVPYKKKPTEEEPGPYIIPGE